ncbi:MAG TPA: hypothetical protein VNT60_09255, partial [Deinococcales bacterium]|nr:hypothetical protein [Deinococcales bacterium]
MNKKVLALAAASAVLAACGTGVLTVAVPDPPPFKLVDEASIQTPLVTTLDATGSIPEPIVSPPVPVEKQDSLANIPDFIKVQSVGKVELRAKFGLRKGGADSVRSLVFLPKEFENQAFELRNLTAKAVFFRTGDPEPTACTGPNAFDVVSNLTVTGT